MGLLRGCSSGPAPCSLLPNSPPPYPLLPHSLHSSPLCLPSSPPPLGPQMLFPKRGLPLPSSQSRLWTPSTIPSPKDTVTVASRCVVSLSRMKGTPARFHSPSPLPLTSG